MMNVRTRHTAAAVLAVLFCIGLSLLLHASRERRAALACEHVEVELRDSLRFVTEKQVKSWLDRNYGVCVGRRLDSLDLRKIEGLLLSRGPITGCEAWTDDDGVLHLDIRQRRPVLRFSYGDGLGYYVDEGGYIFPLHKDFTADVRVIEGDIPVRPAAGFSGYPESEEDSTWIAGMLAFEKAVEGSRTWSGLVERTIVREGGDIAFNVTAGDELIIIGGADRLDEKLKGLEEYYRRIVPEKGEGYYKTVSLKYKNQIICRQKDT